MATIRIAAAGDSLTNGGGFCGVQTPWPQLLGQQPRFTTETYANSEKETAAAFRSAPEFKSMLKSSRAAIVTLMLGTFDATSLFDEESFVNSLRWLVTDALSRVDAELSPWMAASRDSDERWLGGAEAAGVRGILAATARLAASLGGRKPFGNGTDDICAGADVDRDGGTGTGSCSSQPETVCSISSGVVLHARASVCVCTCVHACVRELRSVGPFVRCLLRVRAASSAHNDRCGGC